jgi:hypothetical protein
MILLFNKIPVTQESKINAIVAKAKAAYGSEFYNVQGKYWKGDDLTVEALFPNWIIQEANDDPSNVTIVQIVKSYLRWLFSIDYGYGAYINWETIRCPNEIDEKLLAGLADLYFPGEDFSSTSNLYALLPNLKKFAIHADLNYFNIKGSMNAIRYLLITLLGLPISSCFVYTGSPGIVIIRANVPEKYKPFLSRSVIPAGMTVIYQAV